MENLLITSRRGEICEKKNSIFGTCRQPFFKYALEERKAVCYPGREYSRWGGTPVADRERGEVIKLDTNWGASHDSKTVEEKTL